VIEIMFDTDVLIDLARRLPACVNFFDELPDDAVTYLSVISKMELLAGCRNNKEQAKVQEFLNDFIIYPLRLRSLCWLAIFMLVTT